MYAKSCYTAVNERGSYCIKLKQKSQYTSIGWILPLGTIPLTCFCCCHQIIVFSSKTLESFTTQSAMFSSSSHRPLAESLHNSSKPGRRSGGVRQVPLLKGISVLWYWFADCTRTAELIQKPFCIASALGGRAKRMESCFSILN